MHIERIRDRSGRRGWCRLRAAALLLPALWAPWPAGAEEEISPVPFGEWLVLGPVDIPLPAFHAERPGAYGLKEWLGSRQYPASIPEPRIGGRVTWVPGTDLEWRVAEVGRDGAVDLEDGARARVAYLGAVAAERIKLANRKS